MSERTGRNILKELLDEGLILTRSEKGAVRLGFPATAAGYWFPDLYPNEARRAAVFVGFDNCQAKALTPDGVF